MKQHSLGQAARAAGISLDYINVNGEKEAISDETLQALLAVMDDPQDAKNRRCRRSRYSAAVASDS